MKLTQREALVRINSLPGIGPGRLRALLQVFGSFEEIEKASVSALSALRGVSDQLARNLKGALRDQRFSDQEFKSAAASGVRILIQDDAEFPAAIKQLSNPPLVLYVRGQAPLEEEPAVAIVGCRGPSNYGVQAAQKIAHDLALRGVSVVSGLARGIDAAAHRGALRAQGKTVAFLGSGLGRIYPEENLELAAAIADTGALYSEFPMSAEPKAKHFPLRNRLVSVVSMGILVVEAAPRSGSLITARLGLEQGKEIFAIPGPIDRATSKGPNRLIQDGAQLVTSAEEVMEALRLQPEVLQQVEGFVDPQNPASSVVEGRILERLHGVRSSYAEALLGEAGLEWGAVQQALVRLELKGRVRRLPGNQYQLTAQGN